uniref:NR LBD domain-containing protein n=1 Tax=Acrobeloides nanus TaxID=290746 RepID=A0A914E9H8_9BILA
MIVESKVFQSFLYSSGLLDEINDTFNDKVLPNWLLAESILATLRHDGFKKNFIYSMNEEYIEVEEKYLTQFLQTDGDLKHAQTVAKTEMKYFKDYLRITAAFQDFSLDEYEIAALLQISLLKHATLLFDPDSRQASAIGNHLKTLFKDLSIYYSNNYEQTAIRFDLLAGALGQLQELRLLHDHHRITMELNGKSITYRKHV